MKYGPGTLALVAVAAMLDFGPRTRRRGGVLNVSPGPTVPPPGAIFTLAQLRELARTTGFSNPDLAAAVAMAESGGKVAAVGDVNQGGSYGLWQIHAPSHPEFDTGRLVREPTYNASAALLISAGGTNWKPWTTYNTGAYRAYMPGGASA